MKDNGVKGIVKVKKYTEKKLDQKITTLIPTTMTVYENSYADAAKDMFDKTRGLNPKDQPINLDTYKAISEILLCHCIYISTYIQVLNKYINLTKRASALKNERNLMIKFVKKLRFLNNYYYFKELICIPPGLKHSQFALLNCHFAELAHDIPELQSQKDAVAEEISSLLARGNMATDETVGSCLARIISQNCKLLEIIEIINFMVNSSLKQEILSKTLNEQLVLPKKFTDSMSHIYCIFVKFNQWMVECLNLNRMHGNLDIELLELVLKNDLNQNINIQVSEEDDLLLQGVDQCKTLTDFNGLAWEWCEVVRNLLKDFNTETESVLNNEPSNSRDNHVSDYMLDEKTLLERPQRKISTSSLTDESDHQKALNIPKRNVSNRRSMSNKRQSSINTRNTSRNSSFY
ncbi:hypothetical protein ACO0OL_001684 [Hanseniaspora opuntiae]